jgi:hypothetical protein
MAERIDSKRESASEIVALANSANYIFNNLKKDPAVSSVSISKSADEIINWLQQNLPVRAKTVAELADRYIHLVALSFFEPKEFLPFLNALPLERIEWENKLAAIMRSRARGTTVVKLIVPPRVKSPQPVPQSAIAPRIIVTGMMK